MKKRVRLSAFILVVSLLTLLSLTGAAWAGPLQQGTIPTVCTPLTEARQPTTGTTVTLNTCTGQAIVPAGAFPRGGKAVTKEQTQLDLDEVGPLPARLVFIGNGLDLSLLTADGQPVKFFSRAVTVCFPVVPGKRAVIRQWDTKFNRWIPFPTFRSGQLICTRTRLPGVYAPVGPQ